MNGKTTELYPLKSKPPCNNPSFTGGVKGLASCRASYKHRPVGHLTRSHERETQGGIICLFILFWALTILECERGLDKPFLLKKIRPLLIIFIKSTLKGAEFLGGNTLFNKSCMPCDRRKLWVGGGRGAVLPYGLDRYVPPEMLTMVSTLKQGIIFVLASIVFRV